MGNLKKDHPEAAAFVQKYINALQALAIEFDGIMPKKIEGSNVEKLRQGGKIKGQDLHELQLPGNQALAVGLDRFSRIYFTMKEGVLTIEGLIRHR